MGFSGAHLPGLIGKLLEHMEVWEFEDGTEVGDLITHCLGCCSDCMAQARPVNCRRLHERRVLITGALGH